MSSPLGAIDIPQLQDLRSPAVLAHELGHIQNFDTLGKLRRPFYGLVKNRKVVEAAPLVAGFAGRYAYNPEDTSKGRLKRLAIGAVGAIPGIAMAAEEGIASLRGLKRLRASGMLSPAQLSAAKKSLFGAFSTYAAAPLSQLAAVGINEATGAKLDPLSASVAGSLLVHPAQRIVGSAFRKSVDRTMTQPQLRALAEKIAPGEIVLMGRPGIGSHSSEVLDKKRFISSGKERDEAKKELARELGEIPSDALFNRILEKGRYAFLGRD